jgi:hypothetical protein
MSLTENGLVDVGDKLKQAGFYLDRKGIGFKRNSSTGAEQVTYNDTDVSAATEIPVDDVADYALATRQWWPQRPHWEWVPDGRH